jgi:hypothetical protein
MDPLLSNLLAGSAPEPETMNRDCDIVGKNDFFPWSDEELTEVCKLSLVLKCFGACCCHPCQFGSNFIKLNGKPQGTLVCSLLSLTSILRGAGASLCGSIVFTGTDTVASLTTIITNTLPTSCGCCSFQFVGVGLCCLSCFPLYIVAKMISNVNVSWGGRPYVVKYFLCLNFVPSVLSYQFTNAVENEQ